jgi:hypothetical protein
MIILTSCERDNIITNNTYILPELTTTGKNTFGCLVESEVFIPKASSIYSQTPILVARYFHIEQPYYSYVPGYYLQIYAFDQKKDRNVILELTASNIPLSEGQTYQLVSNGVNSFSASYHFASYTQDPVYSNVQYYHAHDYTTNNEYTGELTIVKLDENNHIMSGTFSFNSLNSLDSSTKNITSGRFDVKYFPYPN